MNRKASKHRRIIVVMLAVIALTLATGIVYAFAASSPSVTKDPMNPVNKDDATNYLTVTESDGLKTVKFNPVNGDQRYFLGSVKIIGDYMYVYGYYYNVASAPVTSKQIVTDGDSQWVKQTDLENLGWGCVAISKNKTTYADPAGTIGGLPVTHMNNAYRNCKSLTTSNEQGKFWSLPNIASTVKHTDYMFAGCTSLTHASITTISALTSNTFYGCSNLSRIFIGQNLKTASSSSIGTGLKSGCTISLDGSNSYSSGWNSGYTVSTNQDILLWALD